MKNLPPSRQPHSDQGVALVLVLCFVVLVTGLVVAYFSRALTTRQLSNTSTAAAQADILASSAADVILGDLKAEIANDQIASTVYPPAAALPDASTVYVPKQAAYAVPQRNPVPSPAPSPELLPNLVRRSLADDAVAGPGAIPAPALGSRASKLNSISPDSPNATPNPAGGATTNPNGRYVSPARWNRHYLLPTATPSPSPAGGGASGSDPSTPIQEFRAPDWVFVTAEKGPTVLSAPFKEYQADSSAAATTVTPIGRYAYAIYDEGGLLDVNHTGFPSASLGSPEGLSHIGAKPAPSYADLTQLPRPVGSAASLTAVNVDNLLAWRNYATLQATGTFPLLRPAASLADGAYYNFFASYKTNPLQVSSTLWNGNTDQPFLSRQQLIGYFNAAGLDPRYLQYLGTFSRSLNQPSYVQESNRPKVLPSGAGGNNAGDTPADPSTNITPNFLTARVDKAFPRNSNRDNVKVMALPGEPLVKKRFALNRLAWLTYRGPSSMRATASTATSGEDGDIGTLKKYGITKEFLDQGTEDNIEAYFGLRWENNPQDANNTSSSASKGWTYVHGGGGILNINNSLKGTDVVRQGREPDFFELLKASINPGSIAKSSYYFPGITNLSAPITRAAQDQYKMDYSLDLAILRIGANIIDQFDVDGFPTRINHTTNVAVPAPVFGDENLPYISRVRNGVIRVKEADPLESAGDNTMPIKNTGVAALMNLPEIWNPHGWSNSNLDRSLGVPAPSNFKIYAQNSQYNFPKQDEYSLGSVNVLMWNKDRFPSTGAVIDQSPGFLNPYQIPFGIESSNKGGENRYLRESNTKMTFNINRNDLGLALFRQPTILYRPNFPTGSNLASPALKSMNSDLVNGLGYIAKTPGFFDPNGGLISDVGSTSAGFPPMRGAAYIGFYIGAHPLRWWYQPKDGRPASSVVAGQTQFGFYADKTDPIYDVTYVLACEDGSGNWIPYDAKSVVTTGSPAGAANAASPGYMSADIRVSFGLDGTAGPDFGNRFYQNMDPRTSRFGMVDPYISDNSKSIQPRGTNSVVSIAEGTLKTDREDTSSGTALFFNPFAGGGDQYPAGQWFSSGTGWYHSNDTTDFRPGLLSQNNPNVIVNRYIKNGLGGNYNVEGTTRPFYYADADGVVRRASGGNVPRGGNSAASTTTGLPMAEISTNTTPDSTGSSTIQKQIDSRPVILNRPFQSVTDLGYVYSGTPWKNLDFFLPESGDVGMLDVFCVNDTTDDNALSAGQVNLNTHQAPVLRAVLSQANKDLWNDVTPAQSGANATILPGDTADAQRIATALVSRTVQGPRSGPTFKGNVRSPQPLRNVSDLVGRWVQPVNAPYGGIDGKASSDGLTDDLAILLLTSDPTHNIQRFQEGAIRALSNVGQVRVWNLLLDIVAQTGRYPAQASKLDQFNVEGEKHYWVHVAIDRYTGKVIDKQVEIVKE